MQSVFLQEHYFPLKPQCSSRTNEKVQKQTRATGQSFIGQENIHPSTSICSLVSISSGYISSLSAEASRLLTVSLLAPCRPEIPFYLPVLFLQNTPVNILPLSFKAAWLTCSEETVCEWVRSGSFGKSLESFVSLAKPWNIQPQTKTMENSSSSRRHMQVHAALFLHPGHVELVFYLFICHKALLYPYISHSTTYTAADCQRKENHFKFNYRQELVM